MKLKCAFFLSICALFGVRTASAQSPYVGISLIGDIVRTSHAEGSFDGGPQGSGESIGFGVKIGAPVAANWGVELEFVRPSEIEGSGSPVYPLLPSPLTVGDPAIITTLLGSLPSTTIFPSPVRVETRDRYTTLSTVAWASQDLSDRVSLIYLGGVAFNRSEHEYGVSYNIPIRPISSQRTINYGVRPVVGLESRIAMTDHLSLVPGIRLVGLQDAWLFRPAVGVRWSF